MLNWDGIERNWERFIGAARAKWDRLGEEQLAAIAGRRDRLADSIGEAYGITREASQRQIDQWQLDQKGTQGDDERGERLAGRDGPALAAFPTDRP